MSEAPRTSSPSGVEVDGEAVRDRRKLLGHTITTMAPLAAMSIGYLSQIERGHRATMSPPAFQRLAAALGLADTPHRIMRQRRSSSRTVRA